jgi:hypothetical protein
MLALSKEIHNGPVIASALKVFHGEVSRFSPPESTTEQKGENCAVALATDTLRVRGSNQFLCLLRSEPITQADPESLCSFYSRIPAAKSGLSKPMSAAS